MKKIFLLFAISISFHYACSQNKGKGSSDKIKFENFTNLSDALKKAKAEKKLILLYFTGYSVINDDIMKNKVLSNDSVINLLNKKFIVYKLYVDSRTKLDKPYRSKTGELINTEGAQASLLEMEVCQANTQPHFAILNYKAKLLGQMGFTEEANDFINFLKTVK